MTSRAAGVRCHLRAPDGILGGTTAGVQNSPARLRLTSVMAASLVLLPIQVLASGNEPGKDPVTPPPQRPTLTAIHAVTAPVLDGRLDDSLWQRPGYTQFTQRDPDEGKPPSQKTEVWIAYNDDAIYFAARMYDSSPDSIVSRLGRRDADLNSDWLYVGIDSYHDRRTGFYFAVNPAGSIIDGTLFNDEDSDNSWDGVWDASTAIDDSGWTAEIRIPYSQLRFRKQQDYVLGVNFERIIERRQEKDYLVMVPKAESGNVSRFADLVGIKDIDPPAHLEVLPYVVSSLHATNQYDAADPLHSTTSGSGGAGADIKLGLGSNLTMDATINPDFGQVEVDPAVVNLTQFETYFDEKRPFFIEGSNFFRFGNGGVNSNWGFNWGTPTFFYTRRIGRPPQGDVQHSGYADVPDRTTIHGAAKFTGKIGDDLSLGGLASVTAQEEATVDDGAGARYSDVVEPLASYNVVRLLKEFNAGRQGLGILGTGAFHRLNETYLDTNFYKRSYTYGIDGWTNLDSTQTYVVTSWIAGTHNEGTPARMLVVQQSPLHYFQRPDASYLHIDSSAASIDGYGGRIAVNKQKGNFMFNSAFGLISPGFDCNDLGILSRTDVFNGHVVAGYQWFLPEGLFRYKSFQLATFRNYDFGGDKTGEGYFLFLNGTLSNYWNIQSNMNYSPAVLSTTNTRGGPLMKNTNGYDIFIGGGTDSRDKVSFNVNVEAGRTESGGYIISGGPGVTWVPGSNINFSVSPSVTHDVTIAQWVTNQADPSAVATYGGRYVFGKLDRKEVSATIRLDWTFTPRLSLQLYLQPLISVGTYREFKELKAPATYTFNRYGIDNGSTIELDSTGSYNVDPDGTGLHDFSFSNPDFNFKSLRGNAVLRWEYMRGSAMYLVWTRSQTSGINPGDFDLVRDAGDLLTAPDHDDVFLVKLTYWWNP